MKLVAIGLYAGILVLIGYFASKKMHNIRDYFASGKNLGFFNVAFSARATGESAWLLLGLTGMGYAVGAKAFWVVLGEMIGVGGAWILMSRRFKRLTDRYDSVTVPDYLESRLRDSGHWLRLIAAGSLVIFVPIYAGAQVFATGGAFHAFLGWDHYVGAAVGFGVVMLYITQGGFTAVVWSDVFQGSLMVIGLVALPIVILNHVGSLDGITTAVSAVDPHLLTLHGPGTEGPSTGGWTTSTIISIIGLAAIGIGFFGSPQVFVRYISMKNTKQILPGTSPHSHGRSSLTRVRYWSDSSDERSSPQKPSEASTTKSSPTHRSSSSPRSSLGSSSRWSCRRSCPRSTRSSSSHQARESETTGKKPAIPTCPTNA